MKTPFCAIAGCLLSLLIPGPLAQAANVVIVHEWGTFTSFQDENGNAIGGINIDDEPVPSFVYDQGTVLVTAQYSESRGSFGLPPYPNYASKAWIPGDPGVTMRLETPVIYFYPPKGETPASVPPLDVSVDFHDGLLSQFYPYAKPGAKRDEMGSDVSKKNRLENMTSSLTWKGVRLGSMGKPIETNDKVWTTPREVSATPVEVQAPVYDDKGVKYEQAQAEHFLFYRGVGHLDSPLFLNRDPYHVGEKDNFYIWPQRLQAQPDPRANVAMDHVYTQGWLTEIRADGSCAFRSISSFGGLVTETRMRPRAEIPSQFETADFSVGNLAKLKASMQETLVKEGLYPDEASAMLRTWELSYFKSPGLRFFYMVPRAWVDQVLPLKITGAATKLTRVMVGRIELITDAQRAALARLATGPCPDLAAVKRAAQTALDHGKLSEEEAKPFYNGGKPLSELGIAIPPLVQDYLSMGRFRDALILHEQREHPNSVLAQFIKDNQLAPQDR